MLLTSTSRRVPARTIASSSRLGREHRALELLHDVAREDRGQVHDGVDARERGGQVRDAQVGGPGLDVDARGHARGSFLRAHQRAHGVTVAHQRLGHCPTEEARRARQQDLHVRPSPAVRSRTSRFTSSICAKPIGGGAPARSAP